MLSENNWEARSLCLPCTELISKKQDEALWWEQELNRGAMPQRGEPTQQEYKLLFLAIHSISF